MPRLASSLERLGGKRDARHERVGRAAVRVPDRLGRGSVPADLYRVVFGPQGTLTDVARGTEQDENEPQSVSASPRLALLESQVGEPEPAFDLFLLRRVPPLPEAVDEFHPLCRGLEGVPGQLLLLRHEITDRPLGPALVGEGRRTIPLLGEELRVVGRRPGVAGGGTFGSSGTFSRTS